jgi:hypothetical protein
MLNEISDSEVDAEALKEFIHIANKPDIGPEMLFLSMKYGPSLAYVAGRVENLRKKFGVNYNAIQSAIIGELNDPQVR